MVTYQEKKHTIIKKAVNDGKTINIVRSPTNPDKPIGLSNRQLKTYSNKKRK
jgi:hypothetical protein